MLKDNNSSNNPINNPISGAMTFGLCGAAMTAIGAAIRKNSVHNEAMVVLVGGVITGAIAGSLGCCLPETKDVNLTMQICFGLLTIGLQLAAFLSAPKIGEHIMNLGTKWNTTVVDELIGEGVLLGGLAAIIAIIFLSIGGKALGETIRHTLWGENVNNVVARRANAQHIPPVAIADVADIEAPNTTVVIGKL